MGNGHVVRNKLCKDDFTLVSEFLHAQNLWRSSSLHNHHKRIFIIVTWASWWSTDQCYPAFIAKHSTLLPVMITVNSSWSSCESWIPSPQSLSRDGERSIVLLTVSRHGRPHQRYLVMMTEHSAMLSCQRSSYPCYSREGVVKSSFIPYCHDESLKVFTLSRWQSSHHWYIFMIINYYFFVLPINLSILLIAKSHSKHPVKII